MIEAPCIYNYDLYQSLYLSDLAGATAGVVTIVMGGVNIISCECLLRKYYHHGDILTLEEKLNFL